MLRASTGYLPIAVSPDSITASVPSYTAFATSVTSALVGRGLRIMESSICVAVITGLQAWLHLEIMIFWMWGTSSAGISTPISPLATIIPSLASIIASRFSIPSAFSIFAMIWIEEPASSRISRISRTASAVRTKDAAIKSKPCSIPKRISALSLSVRAGSLIFTFGTLTPFFSPSSPPFITWQTKSVSFTSCTFSSISPSSIRIRLPSATSSFNPL